MIRANALDRTEAEPALVVGVGSLVVVGVIAVPYCGMSPLIVIGTGLITAAVVTDSILVEQRARRER